MSEQEFKLNNHLIQTFYIFGLDSKTVYDENLYTNPSNLEIEPKVITKFPSVSKSYNCIPNGLILKHCFPTGFKLFKYPIQPNQSNFIFTLDNVPLNYIERNII